MAWQEWLELEAAKSEGGGGGDGDGGGEEKVPALLQMAASQVQHDESLTKVCVYVLTLATFLARCIVRHFFTHR